MQYAIIPVDKANLLSWTYQTPIGQWKLKRKEADGSEKYYIGVEDTIFSESQEIEILTLGGLIFGYPDCVIFWKYEFGVLSEEMEV